MRTTHVDVAIVGAGLSGLAAGRALAQEGHSIVVLEARDRVGGRTLNHQLQDDSVVEVGGQWVGPGQTAIGALIDELGLATFPSFADGESLLDWRGRVMRYRTIPPIGAVALADIAQSTLRLERMARSVSLDAPWDGVNAERHDSETSGSWVRRNVRSARARAYWTLVVQAVCAIHPSELSLLHFLFFLRSSGGRTQRLLTTGGGAQQDRVSGGSQRISERLAEELGDRIILQSPVRTIGQRQDLITLEADGRQVTARRAIVAVPPALAGRIAFDPRLAGAGINSRSASRRVRSSSAWPSTPRRSGGSRACPARPTAIPGRSPPPSTTHRPRASSGCSWVSWKARTRARSHG